MKHRAARVREADSVNVLRRFAPKVTMMESVQPRARNHRCLRRLLLFEWPVMRGVLREAVVNPIVVKVGNVVTNEAPQVLFVQGNHVVQHFPPTATHPSLSDTV